MDQDGNAGRETNTGVKCCQSCSLTVRVAVATTTAIVAMAVFLCLVLFFAVAPEVEQTSCSAPAQLEEQLQQCQRKQQDLDLMLHTATRDSRCRLCPEGWLWWRSRCYFFSPEKEERRSWNKSVEFCQQNNSSLAVIENPAEMDFLQSVMRRFSQSHFLWVDLSDAAQEGRWLWSDGMDVQHYMPLTVQWDSDHRDCADLRGSGSLFAADCEASGHWACEKDS